MHSRRMPIAYSVYSEYSGMELIAHMLVHFPVSDLALFAAIKRLMALDTSLDTRTLSIAVKAVWWGS